MRTVGKDTFVLAGFSFGAASGPFVVKALPAEIRPQLALAAFLSPGVRANFWAGPWSWVNLGFGPRVLPVMTQLGPTPVLCIGDAGVFEDICPKSPSAGMTSVPAEGRHLLTDQYDEITRLIIQTAAPDRALASNPPDPKHARFCSPARMATGGNAQTDRYFLDPDYRRGADHHRAGLLNSIIPAFRRSRR